MGSLTGVVRWLMVAEIALVSLPLLARRHDSEQDLLAHLERETNPVKKAKYEIRLGRLKLEQATLAYQQQQLDQGERLLNEYAGAMNQAWELLKNSGRDATRKPQGFKELDIALRENSRLLEDLRHRIPFTDRGPLDKVEQELAKTRNEVLLALFPGIKMAGAAAKPGAVPEEVHP
jgi:hypothetical protein